MAEQLFRSDSASAWTFNLAQPDGDAHIILDQLLEV
jgi:hypothetical protein